MAAEALKAYQEYMGGSASTSSNWQHQQQARQAQQHQLGAHMQQAPQSLQNPYVSQQQYLQSHPVYVPLELGASAKTIACVHTREGILANTFARSQADLSTPNEPIQAQDSACAVNRY